MEKQIKLDRTGTTTHFTIDKPKQLKPRITGQYIRDGIRYYKGEKRGQYYVADLFDAMFKSTPMAVLPKQFKGFSLDSTRLSLKK